MRPVGHSGSLAGVERCGGPAVAIWSAADEPLEVGVRDSADRQRSVQRVAVASLMEAYGAQAPRFEQFAQMWRVARFDERDKLGPRHFLVERNRRHHGPCVGQTDDLRLYTPSAANGDKQNA